MCSVFFNTSVTAHWNESLINTGQANEKTTTLSLKNDTQHSFIFILFKLIDNNVAFSSLYKEV